MPEPLYLQHLWVRKFLALGVPNIQTHHYKKKIKIIKNLNEPNPWVADKKIIKKIGTKNMKYIYNYFKIRFKNPGKIMSYLTHENSNDNSKNYILNHKGKKILINKDQLVAVIFLHSFDDAQYCFGIDDFEDIYEWTLFSIDKCLSNKNFDKVFIKPHPGTDVHNYPGDEIAYKKIFYKYANNERVVFLKKNSSILYLAKNKNILGITHHGSVAEELTFLGQNVIASVGGTWGSYYKFLNTWKKKDDYELFLKQFNKNSLHKITKEQLNQFYNYILERKINIIESKNYSIRILLSKTRKKYNKWHDSKKEIRGFNNYIRDLKNFEANQVFTKDLIKPIYYRSN